ncbi:MAG: 23S rRNA (uracil(1939)-C(5))-methyltransferase RlmD [Myxococcales bacterium]|nr:23S rRNA (uracil(1939)-C(5))-methyltransferase RlmD [Myxococcales bacterium]
MSERREPPSMGIATIQTIDPTKAWGEGTTPQGAAVRLPGTLPSEIVSFRQTHLARDGTVYGQLEEVQTPSQDRIPVICPKFLLCGGCDYLHATPEAELRWKRTRVAEALQLPLVSVEPVVPSPQPLYYRAVAKWVVGAQGELGSYRPRSHEVVDMKGCHIHAPVLERVGDNLRQAIVDGLSFGGARYIVLRAALPREIIHATVVVYEPNCPAATTVSQHLAGLPEVAEVWCHTNQLKTNAIFSANGATRCIYRSQSAVSLVGPTEQYLATGAFAQINPSAAARLYDRVAKLAHCKGQAVLDLYAGSGGISLTLAQAGASFVLGIERTPTAVAAARRAAQSCKDRVQFIVQSVEELGTLLKCSSIGTFPIWVVNPPRKGLSPKIIHTLINYQPNRIIYVSCQPDTLARDVDLLKETYTLSSVQPVDMFPRTRHVETVACLELRACL